MDILLLTLTGIISATIASMLTWLISQQIYKRRGGRRTVRIGTTLSDELANLPVRVGVIIPREGPDSAPLLNKTYYMMSNGKYHYIDLNYPRRLGLQFKCFIELGKTDNERLGLGQMRDICERNGYAHVSIDGFNPRIFWFIVPEYATKLTEDREEYINNWLPAGP